MANKLISLHEDLPNVSNRQIFVGAVFDRPSGIAKNFHTRLYSMIMGVDKLVPGTE